VIKRGFRVRISTALLLLAVPTYPFTARWVPVTWIPSEPGFLHKAISWLFLEMSLELIAIAFVASAITCIVLSFQRNWRGVVQSVAELGVCIVAIIIAVPAF
jgi:hypothetical protein